MGPRRGWIAGLLLLTAAILPGCTPVTAVDSKPATSPSDPLLSPLRPPGEVHNLAILAVDFDPPLDFRQLIVRRKSVTLLVAVENTGRQAERNVSVSAQLFAPGISKPLLTRRSTVNGIAPGKVEVARFEGLPEIPYYPAYRLEVRVDPVPQESNLADNQKVYDVEIVEDK